MPHLEADDAAADDQHLLRHEAQFQRAGRIDDARVARGMKGRCTAAEPAAMMQFLNLIVFLPPVLSCALPSVSLDLDVMRVEEAAVAAHDLDLAALGHAGETAGELADDLFLVRAQRDRHRRWALRR